MSAVIRDLCVFSDETYVSAVIRDLSVFSDETYVSSDTWHTRPRSTSIPEVCVSVKRDLLI